MMALEPRRGIDKMRKAGGVTFGKTIARESLDLLKNLASEIQSVSAGNHAIFETCLELQKHIFASLPCSD